MLKNLATNDMLFKLLSNSLESFGGIGSSSLHISAGKKTMEKNNMAKTIQNFHYADYPSSVLGDGLSMTFAINVEYFFTTCFVQQFNHVVCWKNHLNYSILFLGMKNTLKNWRQILAVILGEKPSLLMGI